MPGSSGRTYLRPAARAEATLGDEWGRRATPVTLHDRYQGKTAQKCSDLQQKSWKTGAKGEDDEQNDTPRGGSVRGFRGEQWLKSVSGTPTTRESG